MAGSSKKYATAWDCSAGTWAVPYSTGSQIDNYRFLKKNSDYEHPAATQNTLSAFHLRSGVTPQGRICKPKGPGEMPRSYGTSTTMEATMLYPRTSRLDRKSNDNTDDGVFLNQSFSFQKPVKYYFITPGTEMMSNSCNETFVTAVTTPQTKWEKNGCRKVPQEYCAQTFSAVEGTFELTLSDSLLVRSPEHLDIQNTVPDPTSVEVETTKKTCDAYKAENVPKQSIRSSISSNSIVASCSSSHSHILRKKSFTLHKVLPATEYNFKSFGGISNVPKHLSIRHASESRFEVSVFSFLLSSKAQFFYCKIVRTCKAHFY